MILLKGRCLEMKTYEELKGKDFYMIVRDFIIEEIDGLKGSIIFGRDLAKELLKYYTTIFHTHPCFIKGREGAKKFIEEHYEVARNTFDYIMENNINIFNPFLFTEEYTYYMALYGLENILLKVGFIYDNYNQEIYIGNSFIHELKRVLLEED